MCKQVRKVYIQSGLTKIRGSTPKIHFPKELKVKMRVDRQIRGAEAAEHAAGG